MKATIKTYDSNAIIFVGECWHTINTDGYEELSDEDVEQLISDDIATACEIAGITTTDLENYEHLKAILGIHYDKYKA